MMKVIEVLADSTTSWEDAAQQAVEKASKSVHGIQSIYIKEFEAKVDDNRIVRYRINAKTTLAID
ncbi:MAG: dodecin domain-containing protein [Halothiobacillaceae bacterium]|nr:dodecin domain-containing protein [Halothiobacillaceae bacterium]HER35749.1 dodecin domain-containing protein [Halothiobacillaceae bacterium]